MTEAILPPCRKLDLLSGVIKTACTVPCNSLMTEAILPPCRKLALLSGGRTNCLVPTLILTRSFSFLYLQQRNCSNSTVLHRVVLNTPPGPVTVHYIFLTTFPWLLTFVPAGYITLASVPLPSSKLWPEFCTCLPSNPGQNQFPFLLLALARLLSLPAT
jgi:hypothetical protein